MTPDNHPCPHKCGCKYTSTRSNDIKKHVTTRASHRTCTSECPSHHLLTQAIIRVETPGSIAAKQEKRRSRPTVRGGQKRQIAQEPTVPDPKVRCVLDPSRRVETYTDTKGDSSWVTAEGLAPADVKRALECRGLRGYTFSAPRKKDAVRIYDWVSRVDPPSRSVHVPQLTQAYVAFFCFQRNGWTVEFETWDVFRRLLLNRSAAEVAGALRGEQVDCIFGGIDLSIQ
jgi:hypothetical protein